MADMRAHRRLAVDFDAFVTAEGLRDHPCKVRDFCLGGVLLSFEDPLRPASPAFSTLERGTSIQVRVITRSPGFRDAYTFTASVTRRDRLNLGVAFTNPDPTSLMALQSLANVNSSQLRTGPRAARPKVRPDDTVVRSLMASMRAQVEQSLGAVPEKLFGQAREIIDALVTAASNDEERHRIMDSLGTLKRHASNIHNAFMQQALKPVAEFDKWQTGAIIPAASNTYRLSLIEKGAFEDWLAIKVMVSRAESECQESLFELHIRLNELLGTTLSVQSNPMSPAVFLHAIGEPLQKIRLPKPVEQGMLRAVENLMLDSLMDMYPRLNALLAKHGILPDLELGKYMRAITSDASPRRDLPRNATATTSATTSAPLSSNVPSGSAPAAAGGAASIAAGEASAASTVSAPTTTAAAAGSAESTASPVAVSADRLSAKAALSVRQFEMQQRIAQQSYGMVQRLLAVRQASGASMPSGMVSPAANSSSAVTSNVTADVSSTVPANAAADAVLEVAATGDAPQEAIASTFRLESVLPKLPEVSVDAKGIASLQDRLAVVLGAENAAHLPPTQAAAVETVDEIFSQLLSTSLLRDETRSLLRQLDVPYLRILLADPGFLLDENHPARQVINRLAALGARGAITTTQQQSRITDVVTEIGAANGDPAVFQKALVTLDDMHVQQQRIYEHNLQRVQESSSGRQRLLEARQQITRMVEETIGGKLVPRALLTLLDAGWRESMVRTLLRHGENSSELLAQRDVILQMLRGIQEPGSIDMKGMLGAIKRGLASQANSQLNREAVISDLREMFTAISAGHPDAVPSVEMPVGAVTAAEEPPPAEDSHTLGRWVKRAREIAIGDWVEFLTGIEEEKHQACLAWHDEDRNQFVFVNLQGMKVVDLAIDVFARLLRDTRAWRIDDAAMPIVDRSLEAMVQKVYGQLAHRATHDELTGLLNRKEFEKRLQRQANQLEPGSPPWLLCWLDLDQFKVINSTCGFEAGDRLIREVGEAIVSCVGKQALVSRLGGDEFAILSPAAIDSGRPIGHIIEAIDRLRFQWADKSYPVGASAGVVFVSSPSGSAEDLMKYAETACYAAKEAGRNRVQVFQIDDAQLARRDDMIQWVSRLNQAIEKDHLQLRCQLIRPVDAQSGLLPHYEILVAIEDENGEFIPPSSFMQAAERYNRMHAVDRWVISNVLAWMHDNPASMAKIDGFAINLSGQSLNDQKLTSWIVDEIKASKVAREKVTFEVTETAAIANLADAVDFIRELQSIGCRFALDDFGSGLSSYSYLKNLPVDYVKIDGVFIREIHRNASDYMMVRSINEMAHFMGKRTIAEYVENDEILEKLREIGVDFAQGYGIERPRPLETLGT